MNKLYSTLILLISLNIYSQTGNIIYSLPNGFTDISEEEQNAYIVSKLEDIIKDQILFFDTSFGESHLNTYGTSITIYEILDSLLFFPRDKSKVVFKENKIYQFSCYHYKYLYNNVLMIKNGDLHIFRALNCSCPQCNCFEELKKVLFENDYSREQTELIVQAINDIEINFSFFRRCGFTTIKCKRKTEKE